MHGHIFIQNPPYSIFSVRDTAYAYLSDPTVKPPRILLIRRDTGTFLRWLFQYQLYCVSWVVHSVRRVAV